MAGGDKTGGKTFRGRKEAAADPNVADINARRPPSARLRTNRCGAALTKDGIRTGEHCSQAAGFQTDHAGFGQCRLHGGITPAGKKSAARQAGRELIQQVKFGGDLKITNVTAEQALIEEVRRSTAMVRWLEERIGAWQYDIDPQAELGGLPRMMGETWKGNSQLTDQHAWLICYREERAHAAKVAKMAIDAGIAERMVRIAEDQGIMLGTAIKAVLDALNLTPRQAKEVPKIVPGILRSISAGEPLEVGA